MWKTAVLITLTLTFLSVQSPFPRVLGQTTALIVQPEGVFGLAPGNAFSVNVTISDVADLYSWQFSLYYNSSVLNATSVVEGPFLKAGGAYTFYITAEFSDNYNATHGRMLVACSRTGDVPGVDGSGTLATVTFRTVGYGYSLLHLGSNLDDLNYYSKLIDSFKPFGNLIPHAQIDGEVYAGIADVAINAIDALAIIPQGSIAHVNVTTQNDGEFQATFNVTLNYNGTPIDGAQTISKLPSGESKTVTFAWDILLLPLGQYNLTATATTIPGETDTSDNTLSLLVKIGAADLAIVNTTTLKTIVGQEYPLTGNVTVKNQGEFSARSNITVYLNQSAIATFPDVMLSSGESQTFTFTWNATILKGNYTLRAYISPVPHEPDTTNNNFTNPAAVMVGIPGDISLQFNLVDMRDIAYVAKRFGTTPSVPLWDWLADLDGSGKVDMRDLGIVAKNFGKHEP